MPNDKRSHQVPDVAHDGQSLGGKQCKIITAGLAVTGLAAVGYFCKESSDSPNPSDSQSKSFLSKSSPGGASVLNPQSNSGNSLRQMTIKDYNPSRPGRLNQARTKEEGLAVQSLQTPAGQKIGEVGRFSVTNAPHNDHVRAKGIKGAPHSEEELKKWNSFSRK